MRTTELHPNAENATTEELRVAMEASPTKRGYIRLAAIHSLLSGVSRAMVCKIFFRSDRMVRLWIERFNRGGIDALITRPASGRPRLADLERVRAVLAPVLLEPAQAQQTHWTAVKVQGYLKEKLAIDLGYRTAVRWLHELDFHLRVPRLWPERQDEEKRRLFLEQLGSWTADEAVELWFLDESGVEGDPRPRHPAVDPGQAAQRW